MDDSRRDSISKVNGRLRKSVDMKDEDIVDEQSPLLPARTSDEIGKVPALPDVMSPDDSSGESPWDADTGTKEQSKSSWYLFLLTISLGG